MKTLLLVCALCACGGSEKKGDEGSGSTSVAQLSLEEVALRWGRAALGGNRAEAIALSITHAQLVALSTKQIERPDFDGELGALLDGLAREGSEQPGARVVAARVAQQRTLPASEKRKRELEIAMVSIVVEDKDGKRHEGMPMVFLRTDAGWRFSPKQ